jgi:hypothetical protein
MLAVATFSEIRVRGMATIASHKIVAVELTPDAARHGLGAQLPLTESGVRATNAELRSVSA